MKINTGHFGEITNIDSSSIITTTSNIAETSLNTTFDKVAQLAKTEEIQAFIKENNLGPYLQDINKERVKNVLSIIGLIWLGKLAKTPIGLALIGATTVYVMFSNKDKLIEKISIKEA